ncbi:MAG: LysM domain-containing protein [Pseudomonadota bacterium]
MASEQQRAHFSCPICNLERVSFDHNKCPQCDADLTCFKVLDSLPDKLVEEKNGFRFWNILLVFIIIVFMCFVGVVAGLQLIRPRTTDDRPQSMGSGTSSIVCSGERIIRKRIIGHNIYSQQARPPVEPELQQRAHFSDRPQTIDDRPLSMVSVPSSPEKTGFWVYIAKEEDTLWEISETYYGAGIYYPVLLEHNPNIGTYTIGNGIRIKILKDIKLAKQIYKKIVAVKGDKIYWNYTIAEGDTLRSLAIKFYKTEKRTKKIVVLNPDMQLRPGTKVRIGL